MKRAVVLLSGGLDSATALYYAKKRGYKISALIFDYGQRHKKEINCAKKIAKHADCDYEIIKFSLPWKGSSLLDKKAGLPKNRNLKNISGQGIPSTYVPARNIIFLSFAVSYAESINAKYIFLGANAIDYSGYPDCRQEFFDAFKKVVRKGMRCGVERKSIRISVPLLKKTKFQIVKLGLRLKVPYRLTWSCYKGGKKPCGACDSCLLRKKGFDQAGVKDPIYAKS